MKAIAAIGIACVLSTFASVFTSTSALAWGCRAETRRGGYGYSYHFADRGSAARRALYECQIRNRSRCFLEYCNRWS